MELKELLNSERSRMEAFRLLSECYFLPDQGLSEKLEDLQVHLANVCEPATEYVQNMRAEIEACGSLESFIIDFSKLFVGPYQLLAAPYGSVYLDGQRKMMGDSTLDVRNRYLDAGLDMAGHFYDAPDHIAAELEFMYILIFNEIEAIHLEQLDEFAKCLNRQKSFLTDHLGAWAGHFCRNIEIATDCEFYLNLARATRVFVAEDLNYLSSLNVYQAS